jgi:hypothetical protein
MWVVTYDAIGTGDAQICRGGHWGDISRLVTMDRIELARSAARLGADRLRLSIRHGCSTVSARNGDGLPAAKEGCNTTPKSESAAQATYREQHEMNILRECHIVELRLRHKNSSIRAQGCDLELPLVGERPAALLPSRPVRGVAPGAS